MPSTAGAALLELLACSVLSATQTAADRVRSERRSEGTRWTTAGEVARLQKEAAEGAARVSELEGEVAWLGARVTQLESSLAQSDEQGAATVAALQEALEAAQTSLRRGVAPTRF